MRLSKASTANFGMSVSTSTGLTLPEAQLVIEARRLEYNEERTHSTIGDVTPLEFINTYQDEAHVAQESTSLAVV